MNRKQIKVTFLSLTLAAISPLVLMSPVKAADRTWDGSNSLANLNANWVGNNYPLSSDNAVFPASALTQTVEHTSAWPLVSIIFNGSVSTSSKNYVITSDGGISLTGGIDAVMEGNGGDHRVASDVTLSNDVTFRTSGSNTLAVGDLGTTLDLGSNTLTLDASGGTISLSGSIDGTGTITKTGEGKTKILTNNQGNFSGSVSVPSGELDASSNAGLPVSLSGGTLKGTGTVGAVTMSSGKVAPGASPGVLNTGDLTYTGGTEEVELGGTADGQYDQVNVTGSVNLGTSTNLDILLFGGYEPAVNDVFTIINNDGTDAVVGNFSGLVNGDKVTLAGYTYQINYDAGDGNDVLLLVTGTPSVPDTGVGSLVSNPMFTILTALIALGIIGAFRFADSKKTK